MLKRYQQYQLNHETVLQFEFECRIDGNSQSLNFSDFIKLLGEKEEFEIIEVDPILFELQIIINKTRYQIPHYNQDLFKVQLLETFFRLKKQNINIFSSTWYLVDFEFSIEMSQKYCSFFLIDETHSLVRHHVKLYTTDDLASLPRDLFIKDNERWPDDELKRKAYAQYHYDIFFQQSYEGALTKIEDRLRINPQMGDQILVEQINYENLISSVKKTNRLLKYILIILVAIFLAISITN